jgi:hypothetical protein
MSSELRANSAVTELLLLAPLFEDAAMGLSGLLVFVAV